MQCVCHHQGLQVLGSKCSLEEFVTLPYNMPVTSLTHTLNMSYVFAQQPLQVLGSNSSLEEFVTSTDSQGGLLHLTLNVTGPQGLPSDEGVKVSLLDEANTTLYTESVKSAKGGDAPGERTVSLKLRQPPGEYWCCRCC
jgi:hypothetical protein